MLSKIVYIKGDPNVKIVGHVLNLKNTIFLQGTHMTLIQHFGI